MITLHGEEVKVGDKVWHVVKGWGEVTAVSKEWSSYPICVRFGGRCERFTQAGKFYSWDKTPLLFWQPIEFEITKKPKPKKKEKAWQWACRSGGRYWITGGHYTEKEAVATFAELIEPYLPSEIEREVKE